MRREMRNSSINQLLAALVGGAIVAAVLLALGYHRSHEVTTVVEDVPSGPAATDVGLTPRQIYQRDAPGVVFVSAKVVENTSSPFNFLPAQQSGSQTGSGFVIR